MDYMNRTSKIYRSALLEIDSRILLFHICIQKIKELKIKQD